MVVVVVAPWDSLFRGGVGSVTRELLFFHAMDGCYFTTTHARFNSPSSLPFVRRLEPCASVGHDSTTRRGHTDTRRGLC